MPHKSIWMVCHKTAINLWDALKKTEYVLSILCVVQITSQIFDFRNTTVGSFKIIKSLLDHLASFLFSTSPAWNWTLRSLSDSLQDLSVSQFQAALLICFIDNVHLCYWESVVVYVTTLFICADNSFHGWQWGPRVLRH